MSTENPDMFEIGDEDEYSAEELLEQAQINAQALFLGTAQALASSDEQTATWMKSLANTFIRGWDIEAEWEPADILFALVTNYQAYGAEVNSSDFEADVPEVKLANLPNVHLADALEIPSERMHLLFRIGEDLTSRLGGKLTWTANDDDTVTLRVAAT